MQEREYYESLEVQLEGLKEAIAKGHFPRRGIEDYLAERYRHTGITISVDELFNILDINKDTAKDHIVRNLKQAYRNAQSRLTIQRNTRETRS